MKKKVRALVTSAGVASAINVISALRKSKKFDLYLYATDMSMEAAGLYLADDYQVTTSANNIGYLKEITNIIKKNKIEFIFPMHSSEIEFFAENIEYFLSINVGIIVPDKDIANLCNSKKRFFKAMDVKNFPIPKIFEFHECDGNFPVFIKPNSGSSSAGALKINNMKDLSYQIGNCPDNFLIQEYIDWKEITVDCYVSSKGVLIGCVPRYRVKVKDGKSVVSKTLKNTLITKACQDILSSINYKGVCNIQFFLKNNEYKLIEINPRFAAGGLPISTEAGINIPELMLSDFNETLDHKLHPYNSDLKMYRYLTQIFI